MGENVRALQSLLAGVKAKVNATEAILADLHNRQSVLEQMLAEEMRGAPPIDTINMHQFGDVSGDSVSGDKVEVHHPSAPVQWKLVGKTEAVERVLSEADQPLGPTEIMERLEAVGLPQRDTEAVRGALAWMKRKGSAKALARSRWVLVGGRVDQRLSQEAPSPEEPGDEAFPPEAERPVTTVSPVRGEESPGGADSEQVEVGR
jgi:hypothetical protein